MSGSERQKGRERERARCLLCALMKYNEAPKFCLSWATFCCRQVQSWVLGGVAAWVAAYFQDLRLIDLPCWPTRFMRCDKRFMVYLFEVRVA